MSSPPGSPPQDEAQMLSEAVDDFMSASTKSGASGFSMADEESLVEDNIAAFDDFLAKKGRTMSHDVPAQPNPIPTALTSTMPLNSAMPLATLTHVTSAGQFSALSESTTSQAPPAAKSKGKSKSNSLGIGNGDDEYDDELVAFEEEEEAYSDDDNTDATPSDVFVRIGAMTVTKKQAKLYGLERVGKSKFVKSASTKTAKPSGSCARCLTSAKMDKIAAPVRRYTAKESTEFAKESEKINCTFKVRRSAAAIAAMNAPGCGYDFIADDNQKFDNFIKRMDAFENHRRGQFTRKQEEQAYNQVRRGARAARDQAIAFV